MPDRDYVQHMSSLTFSETVDHLVATIETVGMNVFAKIDHAAAAKDVGMSLPSSVVLIYGHARGGTPVMQAAPAAALDLPLRVLIRETDRGETVIAFLRRGKCWRTTLLPASWSTGLRKPSSCLSAQSRPVPASRSCVLPSQWCVPASNIEHYQRLNS